jgi:hypothetical protein
MASTNNDRLLFELGALAVTADAAQAAALAGVRLVDLLIRHLGADWGDLDDSDQAANTEALATGGRLLSSYHLATGADIWIITDADRASTTVLIASEY